LFQLLQRNQQKHTLRCNYSNVLMRKLLLISALTVPSSGSTHLYKTNRPILLSFPLRRIVTSSSVYDYKDA